MSKLSDERYTPDHVLEVVRRMFIGDWFIDPCTTETNLTDATYYCTVYGTYNRGGNLMHSYDGLHCKWNEFGRQAFVNPPYSTGMLKRWMLKCIEESKECCEVIALIPSDLGTEAGTLVATTANAICFVKGRLAFGSPSGQLAQGAKQPSVMPYWGERQGRFKRIFSQLGTVWVR